MNFLIVASIANFQCLHACTRNLSLTYEGITPFSQLIRIEQFVWRHRANHDYVALDQNIIEFFYDFVVRIIIV